MKSYERFDLTKNVSNLPTVLVYESLRKQHKYLEVPRLGILFDEIPTSNYLEIAFIFGLQTL